MVKKKIVRLATLQDVPDLSTLYTQFYANNHAVQPEYCADAVETGEYPTKIITSENSDIFVAVKHERIVGFIHIEKQTSPKFPSVVQGSYAEVVDLFIHADYRRFGIGRRLLESAKEWARERRLDCLELLVLGNNHEGIRFYKREKFRVTAKVMKYDLHYDDDANDFQEKGLRAAE